MISLPHIAKCAAYFAVMIASAVVGSAVSAGNVGNRASPQWGTISIEPTADKSPPRASVTIPEHKARTKEKRGGDDAGRGVVASATATVERPAPPAAAAQRQGDHPAAATRLAIPAETASQAAASTDRKLEASAYASAVQKFCSNIIPVANDARIAWQRRRLADLEKDIADRASRLDTKIVELRNWLKKREEFSSKATNALAQMFTKMKPEAAASQISEMDDNLAAALIMRIGSKSAAPILSEMHVAKAAQIARLLTAAASSDRQTGALDPVAPPTDIGSRGRD